MERASGARTAGMGCSTRWGERDWDDAQIKEIVLEKEDLENRKFLREVRMLALMKNKYIVRYNSVRA